MFLQFEGYPNALAIIISYNSNGKSFTIKFLFSHLKMYFFAISSFAIIEEMASAENNLPKLTEYLCQRNRAS